VLHMCNPSYTGCIGKRITVQVWPFAKAQSRNRKITKQNSAGEWLK
jgi:hypothetical protein